jgi:hypothetical protein
MSAHARIVRKAKPVPLALQVCGQFPPRDRSIGISSAVQCQKEQAGRRDERNGGTGQSSVEVGRQSP